MIMRKKKLGGVPTIEDENKNCREMSGVRDYPQEIVPVVEHTENDVEPEIPRTQEDAEPAENGFPESGTEEEETFHGFPTEDDSTEESSDEEERRKSKRVRKPRPILTYAKVGGVPTNGLVTTRKVNSRDMNIRGRATVPL